MWGGGDVPEAVLPKVKGGGRGRMDRRKIYLRVRGGGGDVPEDDLLKGGDVPEDNLLKGRGGGRMYWRLSCSR